MELSDEKKRQFVMRLLSSRMRLLCNHGFYGLLLMHAQFSLDETLETAATDGLRIYFSPAFLDELSDSELDFILMHEVMHIVLKHCIRGKDLNNELYNIACDIVVNSVILEENGDDIASISLSKYGESMHITPNGDEGRKYTAEQVYLMLIDKIKERAAGGADNGDGKSGKAGNSGSGKNGSGSKSKSRKGGTFVQKPTCDDHGKWGTAEDEQLLSDLWDSYFENACNAIRIRESSNAVGNLPVFAKRLLKEMHHPTVDWRTLLNDFVQEEVVDYSFVPPDKRYDGPFFLPDFNDIEFGVSNILFMVDASGSVSDDDMSQAFYEVKSAIDQFNGRLKGWMGYFDAAVSKVEPLEDAIAHRAPVGGGGTSFLPIFKYALEKMEEKPDAIIILTDGYAFFPKQSVTEGIPVLWLINNNEVNPPWGKVARMVVE